MGLINPAVPTIGDPNSTEDVDIRNAFNAIIAEFNGNIDNSNIKAGAGIDVSKLANQTPGQLLIANASGVVTGTVMTGDVAVNSTGVATVQPNAITDTEVDPAAAIQGSKLNTDKGRLKQGHGLVAGSGAGDPVLLGASYIDVPGATVTFTPDVACYALVMLTANLQAQNAADNSAGAEATIVVDGTPQTDTADVSLNSANAVAITISSTVSQVFRIPLTAASHTLKVQARLNTDGASGWVFGAITNFLYQLVAQ